MARVLIIEDEPNINLVLKTVLNEEGHNVTTLCDGLSGLKQLKQIPAPEIVFVDIRMPVLSGKAVIETMRSDPNLSNIPVVIMTGSMPNNKEFPPQNFYDALLPKPFDIYEVIETVEVLTS